MGQAKNWMIEMEERGYGDVPNVYVCAEEFEGHRMITDYIKAHGIEGVCDYSKRRTRVVPLEDVVSIVVSEFKKYYEQPEEECSYRPFGNDPEEYKGSGFHLENGGYVVRDGHSICDTREALYNLGFDLDNEELLTDIAACFNNDSWILIDPYGPTEDEELQQTWWQFNDGVCRLKQKGLADEKIWAQYAKRLEEIVGVVRTNMKDLIISVPEGMPFFRCVYYNPVPVEVEAHHLWAPPKEKASSQRMSREGQSRFYASFDKKTPLLEATNADGKIGLLGRFILKDRVQVLDLSKIPPRSYLDVKDFFSWCFLIQFADYIAQPVDEDENYKYVPTQIMRDVFEQNFPEVQGIRYKSCKNEGKENVVMFWDNKTCGKYIRLETYKEIRR